MFSWGEDCQRGFWLKDGNKIKNVNGVYHLNLNYHIEDLSAARTALAFVKTNGNAFIIPTHETKDGKRVRGKQKFIKCKEEIRAVCCRDDLVVFLSESGSVLCVDITNTPFTPRPLTGLSNIKVSQVACGSHHSAALTNDGQVYTWGQNSRGQLGLGKKKSGVTSPQHLRSVSVMPLVQIAAGGEQSFALTVSGCVFGWGRNDCGQLGLGDTKDRLTPTPLQCLNMKKTTRISCGKDHTAILTKDGVVFTFGSGRHGQLGHNSLRDEQRPRLVAELFGAKVTKIACGRHHTLVLTDNQKVYAFGCGDHGQLGRGEEGHPSVPLAVPLPQDSSDHNVGAIYAGDTCSYATCLSDEEIVKDSNPDSVNSIARHCIDDLIDQWTSSENLKSWNTTKREINTMFSSASCLNRSFLDPRKHFQTSQKYHGLSLGRARLAFMKLVSKENILVQVEATLLHMLPFLDKKPLGVEGLRIYLLLTELLHVIQIYTLKKRSTKLRETVATAIVNLSAESLQVIGNWWSSLSPSTMMKHVKVWKDALHAIQHFAPVPRNPGVRNLLVVLQHMYNANSRVTESRRLPDSNFCLNIDVFFLREEIGLWLQQTELQFADMEPLILCKFPIVMDLKTKKVVLDSYSFFTRVTEAKRLMEHSFEDFFCYQPIPKELFFILELKRESVLEDTLKQLASAPHRDYRRQLGVFFDENCELDEVYVKDFFYKVFHELVSPESGLFMFNDSETLAWFSSKKTQKKEQFFLFGLLCGLALYNKHIIYLPFPLVLFKKLLGGKPTLEDLIEFSPCLGKSLRSILHEYSDDVIEDLCMDFTVFWDGAEVELDPKNPDKPVTSQNKKEFVDAYVNYTFNTSVENLFQEFKRGFFHLFPRDLVKLFRPKELQAVLVGKDFHDWEKFKQNTQYEGEYEKDHPNIQIFWEVFDQLSENEKKTFLWFVTGFEQVPISGMDTVKMVVREKPVKNLSDDDYYPETHTCVSVLELPSYSSKEVMQAKLTEALNNSGGIYR